MSNTALKVSNLSKMYRLGQVGTGTISHDLNRWWHKVRGKDDPYLKVGQTNDRSAKGDSEYVWALRDINFEVEKGEVLGIIGKNGAGKSTLLKILSKVTGPTTGEIVGSGRIASLLEVGTGFHQELTGLENIYLNGTILGMTKAEVKAKLDEIVDFAGVERYLDTPVKRYSSGMMVRLGFAVAAHLEPEILIVDEVLAVGDAEFQKKAIGKMKEVSEGQGRTVLFVSHNMGSIESLCSSVVLLSNGEVMSVDAPSVAIQKYTSLNVTPDEGSLEGTKLKLTSIEDEHIKFTNFLVYQNKDIKDYSANIDTSKPIYVEIGYQVKRKVEGLRIGFELKTMAGNVIFRTFHDDSYQDKSVFMEGEYKSIAIIPSHFLMNTTYLLSISVGIHAIKWITHETISFTLTTHEILGFNKNYADSRPGVIMPLIEWSNN